MSRRWWLRATAITLVVAAAGAAAAKTGGDPLAAAAAAGGAVGIGFAASLLSSRLQRRADARVAAEGLQEAPPAKDPVDPAMLLHPSHRVVPFTGRDEMLRQLQAWCEDDRGRPLQLLTGAGGVGKSRLVVELANALGRRWRTVHVREGAEAEVVQTTRPLPDRRLLVIVDYAETRGRQGLDRLLQDVATETAMDHGRTIRVLLVARRAGDWWTQLQPTEPRVREILAAAGNGIELPAARSGDESADQIVRGAVPHFAARLGVPPPQVDRVDAGPPDRPPRVLDLHAAALIAVLDSVRDGNGDEGVSVNVSDVLDRLLEHENRFWYQSIRNRPSLAAAEDVADQVVAVATLLGARDREEAVSVLGRVPDLGEAPPRGKLAEWVRELYPPDDNEEWWDGLRPDRLAELHVVRQLTKSDELRSACLGNLDDHLTRRAFTLLARATADQGEATALLVRHLPDALASDTITRATIEAVLASLPVRRPQIADLQVLLTDALVRAMPDDAHDVERARSLFNLGVALTYQGRFAEALPPARKAVELFGELYARYPEASGPLYGGALHNLGILLAQVADHEAAAATAERAIEILRQLDDIGPDQYRAPLAGSLHNLGMQLQLLGRPREAGGPFEQAATLYHEICADPGRFDLADLARTLKSLVDGLVAAGRPGPALQPAEDAVGLYERLYELDPDRYRADLAGALSRSGHLLGELDRHAESVETLQRVLELSPPSAAVDPSHRRTTAVSATNLGAAFMALKRYHDALPAFQYATSLFEELAASGPSHRRELAQSQHNERAALRKLAESGEL